jgi:pimeloyl-ACP methyl ester carboxylesterase
MAMTAVLFIHGFPFDHQMWRHQVAALSRWRCIAPDLLGAGTRAGPASPDEYSMSVYADDLIGQLDQLKIEDAVVCGLSMGGYIIFELLRRVPKRVRAVVLCHTKTSADTPEARGGRDELAARAQQEGAVAVARALVPKLLARTTAAAITRDVTAMIERQPVSGIVGALHALRDRPDSTPLLPQIRIPVLVIAGDDDQIAPAAGMEEMARAIPGARFVLIRGSGHLSPLEQPGAFNDALSAFL